MQAKIEKLWCPDCGRFIGLIRSGVDFPTPDAKSTCCRREVEAAKKLKERRSVRCGRGVGCGPGVIPLRADGDWTGW